MKIVIVEDDHGQFEQYREWIVATWVDVQVVSVPTELAFLENFEEFVDEPPQAFIIDVMLRWSDPNAVAPNPPVEVVEGGYHTAGIRCVRRLLDHERTSQTPIIIYSVLERMDVADRLEAFPPNVRFLAKSSDTDGFTKMIGSMLAATGGSPLRAVSEASLPVSQYEHILGVIEQMALVMERAPKDFETLNEESLRSHFLVPLNGHYPGSATGETFNYEGKTDILIRVDGKNVFIGECKFWKGAQSLLNTIDQVLSYSSWRDVKVAIIVFNRRKNFSKVVSEIQPTVETHPRFCRTLSKEGETRFSFVFFHRDDDEREVTVTVLAFDVPAPQEKYAGHSEK